MQPETTTPIFNKFADRIGGENFLNASPEYKFAALKRAQERTKALFPDKVLLDFGIGEPDAEPHSSIIKSLYAATKKAENHSYADNGSPAFLRATAHFMQSYFGVQLNPETEILHSMGNKAALSILPGCFINPGDYALMTTPGYGIFGFHTELCAGKVHSLPLIEKNGFFPDLASIPQSVLEKAKVLVVNYPNNPTGAAPTKAFFQELVLWALKKNIVIINDAAYSELNFPGTPAISILQIPDAKKIALELHSFSKSFNMTGWRLGWVCGNQALIKAYGRIKDQTDCGQFLCIQEAGITALNTPNALEDNKAKYARRLTNLSLCLRRLGFPINTPSTGIFLYTKAPRSAVKKGMEQTFESAKSFSTWLIEKHLISTVPWDEAGPYIRFSATFKAADLQAEEAAMQLLSTRLSEYKFQCDK